MNNRKIWTSYEKDKLVELYDSGCSYVEMASYFDVTTSSICSVLMRLPNLKRRKPNFTYSEIQYLKKHHATKTYKQIALDLGRSYSQVRRYASDKLGLQHSRGENHRLCKISDSEVELIRTLYDDGMSQIEISRKFEVSYEYVKQLVSYSSRTGIYIGSLR